jgi:ubiquinone/menaquinone biosynthesis C-methylase UbiE
MQNSIDAIREYWNSHLNCTQFVVDKRIIVGSEEFYDIVEKYARSRASYKAKLLKEFSAGCKGKKLLEVGCGLGVDLARLGKLGFDVTGIDLAPVAVELAGNYLKRQKISGLTMLQNAEQMDFADKSFDAVYSCGVLQHTPDIGKAISEMIRVLRPEGKMLVILYHRHSWFFLLHRLTGVNIEFEDKDAPIINTYTRKEMKALFQGLRRTKVTCEYCYPNPTRRKGMLPILFNHCFVPASKIVPSVVMRHFGWHLVLTGVK